MWFQLGLVDDAAAATAVEAGLDVVQDHCLRVELARWRARSAADGPACAPRRVGGDRQARVRDVPHGRARAATTRERRSTDRLHPGRSRLPAATRRRASTTTWRSAGTTRSRPCRPCIRVVDGVEVERTVGWLRPTGRSSPASPRSAPDLPQFRPGCGSMSVDPDLVDELRVRHGGSVLRSRRIEIADAEDELEMMFTPRVVRRAAGRAAHRAARAGDARPARRAHPTRSSRPCRPTSPTSPSRRSRSRR